MSTRAAAVAAPVADHRRGREPQNGVSDREPTLLVEDGRFFAVEIP